jgi:hypothetical protein
MSACPALTKVDAAFASAVFSMTSSAAGSVATMAAERRAATYSMPSAASRRKESALRAGARCAESKHRKITGRAKNPASIDHFVALFCCCGAGTRFVHLPFRLKSAFVGVA